MTHARIAIIPAFVLAIAAPALAGPHCKDQRGRFAPCTTAKLAPATACKGKDGRYAKCGTTDAVAISRAEKKRLPSVRPAAARGG